jgi:hypothetical protein
MKSKYITILIDADVVSHFITAGEGLSINKIFPNNHIYILDKVHAELQRWPVEEIRNEISNILSKKILKLIDFPEDNEEIKKEYLWIKSMLFKGDGESASLAVARYDNKILASSNLKDIRSYCITHKMNYLTTMDFLCEALKSGFYSKTKCNDFITIVLKNKGKLPVDCIEKYNCRDIDFL